MKKVIAILLVLGTVLTVCACGNFGGKEENTTVTTERVTTPEEGKYIFKSDKTQKVYKSGQNYMMFYLDGEKITGIDIVMTFRDEKIAAESLKVLEKTKNKKTEKSMVREGKFIIKHMTDLYIKDYNDMKEVDRDAYLKTNGYIQVEKAPVETTVAATVLKAPTTKAPAKKDDEQKSTTHKTTAAPVVTSKPSAGK